MGSARPKKPPQCSLPVLPPTHPPLERHWERREGPEYEEGWGGWGGGLWTTPSCLEHVADLSPDPDLAEEAPCSPDGRGRESSGAEPE